MNKRIVSTWMAVISSFVFAIGFETELKASNPTYQMDEVVISASRTGSSLKDLPQKVEVITEKMLQSLPNETLAEVLKRTTNLDIIQYPGLSATVGMRGFSPSAHSRSYVLILLNGLPAGTTNLASISTDQIQCIEVVKGPYAALYGSDAMGGVINIVTHNNKSKPQASISLESGSFGFSKQSFSFADVAFNQLSYGLAYSHQQQTKDYRIGRENLLALDSVQERMLDKASKGDAMDNTQYELNTANAFGELALNGQWKLRAEGTYTYAYDVETAGNYWGSYGQSKKDINRIQLQSSLEQVGKKNHFRFAPSFNEEQNFNYTNNTDLGYVSFSSRVKEYGYQLQDDYQLGPLNLLFGNDVKVYSYASDRYSAIGTPANPYKPNNQFVNAALLGQASYAWNGLHVNAGLRYDRFDYHIDANVGLNASESDANYQTVNPSFGIQYRFWNNFKIHTAYGSAFSVPDAFKVAGKYSVSGKEYIGNADLEPEKSRTTDVGFSFSSQQTGLNVDVTYFRTHYDHKIVEEKLESGAYTYVNAYKSLMDGVELMAKLNIGQWISPQVDLSAYANFTWMFTNNFTQLVNNVLLTRDMQYVRKANGNFGLLYTKKRFDWCLNGRYMGHRLEKDNFSSLRPLILSSNYYVKGGYTATDKILEHPETLIFDASIGYQYSQNLRFGLSVSNLLDENYTEKDGYNMPGRSINAKLNYQF